MSLMLSGEYGTVAKSWLDSLRGLQFKLEVVGTKVVVHKNKSSGQRYLFLCLVVHFANPYLIREVLGLKHSGDYNAHISVLEKAI